MNEVILIFPNQLFEQNPVLSSGKEVFLIEEERFFSDFKFHKNKLVLHRASLKYYKDFLKEHGFKVNYIEFNRDYLNLLRERNINTLDIIEVVDFKLKEKLENSGFKINWFKSPAFLGNSKDFELFFKDKDHFSQTSFYINQRKKFKVLLDEKGKPIGEKWTFDKENRHKLPNNFKLPKVLKFGKDDYVSEAKTYIKRNFNSNYGETTNFIYPITHKDVRLWFRDFLKNRFEFFGKYEDAVVKEESFLFHSCLSYALNIGLITPSEVIEHSLNFAKGSHIPLNSIEGFIRQILGWREFIKGVYLLDGKTMVSSNFFGHKNKMPYSFYNATTGVYPVDELILRVLKTGYSHHIERLMILGNFMFLCEISPDDIYKWFMEMFIDSYDWVMVPNVYAMSQFADGGKITTKPYFSASNYVKKMSNYKESSWCEIWDCLYWRFIDKNYDYFYSNPRTRMMVKLIDKTQINDYKIKANRFLGEFLDK